MATNWFSAPATVARRVRGYFAAVNRAAQTPVIFDPSEQGGFSLDAPPSPWISLGWIQEFTRKAGSKSAAVLTGIPASHAGAGARDAGGAGKFGISELDQADHGPGDGIATHERAGTGERSFSGRGWRIAATAVTVQSGSTATFVALASADAAKFTAGSIIALDADYTGQTGFVGSPVSGAYVRTALTDVDYIRRVTFNVALVSQVNATGLTLAEPLPGGAPAAGAKLQAVTGFVDREGGSFCQEWSALFVMPGKQRRTDLFLIRRPR